MATDRAETQSFQDQYGPGTFLYNGKIYQLLNDPSSMPWNTGAYGNRSAYISGLQSNMTPLDQFTVPDYARQAMPNATGAIPLDMLNQLVNQNGIGINPPESFMDKLGLPLVTGIAGMGLADVFGGGGISNLFGGGENVLGGVNPASWIEPVDTFGSAAGSSAVNASGGGMGFFDDILSNATDAAGNAGSSIEDFYGSPNENWPSIGQGTPSDVIAGPGFSLPSSLPSWLSNLIPSGDTISKILFGSGGLTGGGGLFGDRGILGSTIAAAPALAAINYAKNTSPFDTSRLENIYSQFDPNASAFQYDVNTGLGRNKLSSDLSRRGVMGSSFGQADVSNYNLMRELGRGALIQQGLGQQAGVANDIVNAQAKDRALKNQLYGSALLALSGALTPRTSGLYAPL